MICGITFRKLEDLLSGRQRSQWDIKLSSIDERLLRAHDKTFEEDNRLRGRNCYAAENYMLTIVCALYQFLERGANFFLTVTDYEAMKWSAGRPRRSDIHTLRFPIFRVREGLEEGLEHVH